MLAHFAHHLLTSLPVPLLPFIRDDFRLNYTQSAVVSSAFSISYGVGQLPAGWLADRIGSRILITIGILGVAIAGAMVGLSQTHIMLIVLMVLMGVLGGGYHPASAPLISLSVEPEKRGRALGLHVIGGSASYFLAPLIAAAIASAWGWRFSFIGMAVPSALFGLILFIMLGQGRGSSHAERIAAEHPIEAALAPGSRRRLVAFLVMTVIAGGLGYSVMNFIPLYITDHFSIDRQTAASLLSIIYSAGLWASPLGGYLSDRIGRVPIILTTSAIGGVLIYLLTVVPYGWGIGDLFFINGLGIGIILFFIGANVFLQMPVSEAYIMGRTSARHRSTVFGMYYFAMHQAGGIFAPLVGLLADHYGFQFTFTVVSIITVGVTLVCSVFLWGRN